MQMFDDNVPWFGFFIYNICTTQKKYVHVYTFLKIASQKLYLNADKNSFVKIQTSWLVEYSMYCSGYIS